MDIFPTFMRAAGGDLDGYELDGLDVLAMLTDRAPSPHEALFWEMGRQNRDAPWTLETRPARPACGGRAP